MCAGPAPPGCSATTPDNGIEAVERYGQAHLLSGEPILYTSQDSVLQVAAHVDVLAPQDLYALCETIRSRLPPRHAVGRVIARPFTGEPGAFERTDGRRDYALPPAGPSYLTELQGGGVATHAVGKVHALFAGVGFDVAHPGATNAVALAETGRAGGARIRIRVHQPGSRPTRSTAIDTTARGSRRRLRRSTVTSPAGCPGWVRRTCW